MLAIFKQTGGKYGFLKKNNDVIDFNYVTKQAYIQFSKNLNLDILSSATAFGEWYAQNNDDNQNITGFDNIDLRSVSNNVHLSSNFDKEIGKILKIVDINGEDDIEFDEDETYTCVSVNNIPSFLIQHYIFHQFERIVISNDDRYIVLVWSRYIAVFDITNKCCVYMCDCEANGIIAEDMNCGFCDIVSCKSHNNGITITYTVMSEDEKTNTHLITFL